MSFWVLGILLSLSVTLIRKEQKCIVKDVVKIRRTYIYSVRWALRLRVRVFQFTFSTFFFFLPAFVDFGRQYLLLWTVYTLFTHCVYIVHVLKNIKNGSHDTIYQFKNYFATVFSIFSFQFSATISSIQTHSHYTLLSW